MVSRSVGDASIPGKGIEHVYKGNEHPRWCSNSALNSFLNIRTGDLTTLPTHSSTLQSCSSTLSHLSIMLSQVALLSLVASMAAAQTLNIPTRAGSIVSLPSPSVITGSVNFGNREFDRGQPCNTDADTGSDSAVFILQNGASISNVIIGANALEGVHCLGTFVSEESTWRLCKIETNMCRLLHPDQRLVP